MKALFYSPALDATQLRGLLLDAFVSPLTDPDQPPVIDAVDFPEEEGGEALRELGVPFLPGMDEIQVDQAVLRLRADPRELEVTDYAVTAVPSPAADQGIVLVLPRPARLRKVELTYATPVPSPGKVVRLVVRPAQKSGAGFSFGAPVYAAPDYPPPGPMFGRVLSGIAVQELGGDRRLVTFPNTLGGAWLIQIAEGDTPTELSAKPFQPQVGKVVIDALPRDLAVELAPAGEPATLLWSHPDLLLPESGEQEVHFTPLAQRALAKGLAQRPPGALTLPVPLRFRASSGGAAGITSRALDARYLVRPLGPAPVTVRLDGGWTRLALDAPAVRRPAGSAVRLVAKLLGRELNAGSPEPPVTPPGAGLRVTAERAAATAAAFLPDAAGRGLPLVSAKLYLAAPEDAEGVLEIRGDAAGAPGAPLAAAVVRQTARGTSGWVEFELPAPLAASGPLWLTLRVTKGQLFWFTGGAAPGPEGIAAPARVSGDQGRSWGSPEEVLGAAGAPLLAQLFHAVPDPLPAPRIRVHRGAALLAADWLADPAAPLSQSAEQPREYCCEAARLPAAVLAALAAPSPAAPWPSGRSTLELRLFSRSVLDLTLDGMTLFYDPFGRL